MHASFGEASRFGEDAAIANNANHATTTSNQVGELHGTEAVVQPNVEHITGTATGGTAVDAAIAEDVDHATPAADQGAELFGQHGLPNDALQHMRLQEATPAADQVY